MSSGLVSIICPMHNGAKFVDETIACVLTQTYSDFELIIVDDNSSDETVSLIKKYDDKRIRLFVNEENRGAAYSRNVAISKAQGKYIAFLDGDDLWKEDKLATQIKFMEDNNYDFSYTDYEVVDEQGQSSGIYFTGPKKVTHRMFLRIDYIGTSTVIYRNEVYPKLEIPNDIFKRNDDAMWLLLSTKCDCYLMKGIYSKYRRNSGSISSGRKSKLFKYHVELYKKLYHWGSFRANFYALRNVFFYFLKQLRFRKKLKK